MTTYVASYVHSDELVCECEHTESWIKKANTNVVCVGSVYLYS